VNKAQITLANNKTQFFPGEVIRGVAHWELENVPGSLDLRLFWYTKGKGNTDMQILHTIALKPSKNGEQEFEFKLPTSPYSFSGKLISLIWALELVIRSATDMYAIDWKEKPGCEAARLEITMSPTGMELLLSSTNIKI
jgi:hypothetical protein